MVFRAEGTSGTYDTQALIFSTGFGLICMYTVADQLVEILEKAGVKRIYGIVGDSLNPITDALRRKKPSNGST